MDLMMDLETLGTKSDCPVISLGAVFFDIEKKLLGPSFYLPMDIQEQLDVGRKVDADTIKWWMQQEDAAQNVFKEKALPPRKVLELFTKFYKQHPKAKVWGNGSTFDISIMESLFHSFKLKHPWHHYNVMDLRTFRRFVAGGAKVVKEGTDHNALDDSISQAKFVMEHYASVGS